jgi:hypothetical protein
MDTGHQVRIGVIYQNFEELLEWYGNTVGACDKNECYEYKTEGRHKGVIPHSLTVHCKIPQKDSDYTFTQRFTFHRVETYRDSHNLAGLLFGGLTFAGGVYDARILNYLNSRIRG